GRVLRFLPVFLNPAPTLLLISTFAQGCGYLVTKQYSLPRISAHFSVLTMKYLCLSTRESAGVDACDIGDYGETRRWLWPQGAASRCLAPMNLPNALTLLRIFFVPLLIVVLLTRSPNIDFWG